MSKLFHETFKTADQYLGIPAETMLNPGISYQMANVFCVGRIFFSGISETAVAISIKLGVQ